MAITHLSGFVSLLTATREAPGSPSTSHTSWGAAAAPRLKLSAKGVDGFSAACGPRWEAGFK